jgi:hypothetical protein
MQPTLLIEEVDFDLVQTQIIEEDALEEGMPKTKSFYITGPMLVSEAENGNKRRYPRPVIEAQVNKYQDVIKDRRSVGECEHPTTSSINMERISHLITELKMEGNIAMGKAKILDKMPLGSVLKNLIESGVKVGVSSRGTGSLKNGIVQNDYNMICIDSVFNPSGPGCFMQSITEGKEWILENGVLTEQEIKVVKEEMDEIVVVNPYSLQERQAAFMKLFQDTLTKISKK